MKHFILSSLIAAVFVIIIILSLGVSQADSCPTGYTDLNKLCVNVEPGSNQLAEFKAKCREQINEQGGRGFARQDPYGDCSGSRQAWVCCVYVEDD